MGAPEYSVAPLYSELTDGYGAFDVICECTAALFFFFRATHTEMCVGMPLNASC